MSQEYLPIQWKGSYCSKLKKGKLKTKKLLQITKYIRWTRALSIIRRASRKLRKRVFTKTWNWKVAAVLASILKVPENKYSGCMFHTRKNPKQQYLKIVTFSDPSSRKKNAFTILLMTMHVCSLDNTLRPFSA